MVFEDDLFKGKLGLLVNEFQKVNDDFALHIESTINRLHQHKWDTYLSKLSIKIHGNHEWFDDNDIEYLKRLIADKVQSLPHPNLSENQKMEIIVGYYADGWLEMDNDSLIKITNRLKALEFDIR